MRPIHVWPVVFALLACAAGSAQQNYVVLDERSGPEPRTATRQFPFVVSESETKLYLDFHIDLTAGKVTVRLLDAKGETLREETTEKDLTVQGTQPISKAGRYHLELDEQAAAGRVQLHVYPVLPAAAARVTLISGAGMVLVVAASVLYARRKLNMGWRWLWAGAAVWTVGVALKFACGFALNKPVLHALKAGLPAAAYLPVAAVYIGLLTGVFEIAVTLAAAFIWRKMAAEAARAVGVGVGAGAFEALLLGLVSLGTGAWLATGTAPEGVVAPTGAVTLLTAVAWLCAPVERVVAILCHTSSRALTLLTVATGRWRYFWLGFAMMTAIDGIAGYFLLSGKVGTLSTWWIELAIVPFGLVSVPLISWCVHRWPTSFLPPAESVVTPAGAVSV